jgi:iron complex transport system ATP-binding protein
MSPALSFHNARLRFGKARWALDGVDASIEAGSVTGILGPNGAGKTTLLKVAAGLLSLESGHCRLHGRDITEWKRETLARHVAYLPQGGQAAWPVTSRDVVALGRVPHGAALGRLSPEDSAAIERALQRADAVGLASRRIDEISAGERMRVLLARALATEADILLADEPAAALDPAHQLQLMELLREEASRGAAVLVTLHELALAARWCDRILVLDQGHLAADGPPATALADDVLARVFSVEAVRLTREGSATLVPWRRL